MYLGIMYPSFYRENKFETVLNFVLHYAEVWPLKADETVRQSYFEQA